MTACDRTEHANARHMTLCELGLQSVKLGEDVREGRHAKSVSGASSELLEHSHSGRGVGAGFSRID